MLTLEMLGGVLVSRWDDDGGVRGRELPERDLYIGSARDWFTQAFLVIQRVKFEDVGMRVGSANDFL